MGEHASVSVLLPTTGWNGVCEAIADQLVDGDELLVICDDAAAIDRPLPDGVRGVVAGDPQACSGKANAVAAGMDAAEHDRIVWTDDDFEHPPGWLADVKADYERQGPTTELPFFVGRDPLALLLEPLYALGGTLTVARGGVAWGGAVIFDRGDLDDEASFLADLRRTVSDDGLLSEFVEVSPADRVRRVEAGGTIRRTLERHVRFTQIVRYHDPRGSLLSALLATLVTAACLLYPLPMLALSTLAFAGVYAAVGVRRWTFLLAYPAGVAMLPLLVYGLARRTFVWGGRRYRWRGKFDVAVESADGERR